MKNQAVNGSWFYANWSFVVLKHEQPLTSIVAKYWGWIYRALSWKVKSGRSRNCPPQIRRNIGFYCRFNAWQVDFPSFRGKNGEKTIPRCEDDVTEQKRPKRPLRWQSKHPISVGDFGRDRLEITPPGDGERGIWWERSRKLSEALRDDGEGFERKWQTVCSALMEAVRKTCRPLRDSLGVITRFPSERKVAWFRTI